MPQPNRRPADPRAAMAARLLLILPLLVGTLLTQVGFAARGGAGDPVSVPMGIVALLLMWWGIAWALRSWVVLLVTFVPAILTTLGAAMVTSTSPATGAVLLAVGGTLLLCIVWYRVTYPGRSWAVGWVSRHDDEPGGPAALPGAAPGGRSGGDPIGGPGGASSPSPRHSPHLPQQPGGPPRTAGDPPRIREHAAGTGPAEYDPADHGYGQLAPRTPPAWDTSRTDRKSRDHLVSTLCQRGGATAPSVISLEEFFTGNGDPRSIAPGLRGTIPLATFATVLHSLRKRHDVIDVLVQIEPLEAGEYPAGEWPAAGGLQIVGTIGPDELISHLQPLHAEPPIGPLPYAPIGDDRPTGRTEGWTASRRGRHHLPRDTVEYAIWWA